MKSFKNSILDLITGKPGKHINGLWAEESIAFCVMPWLHLHITQNGTVTPCCQTPWGEEHAFGNVNKQSIQEIWNGEAIMKMRLQMMKDKTDSRCERCYIKERTGITSLRQNTNRMYVHHFDKINMTDRNGYLPDSPPVYFDLRFSNLCNFKCRICGPASSSAWYQDAKDMGAVLNSDRVTHSIKDEEAFFDSMKKYLPLAEEIYFAGGEPLLMEQHYRMLDLLLEAGNTNVLLRYSTNFSVFNYKGKSVLDYWKKFKHVKIYTSLDDSGARGEYQRKGQNWEEVLLNRALLRKECEHVQFAISPTVSVLNIFHLPAFHRELVEIGFIEVGNLIPSVLEEPYEYNLKSMPVSKKQEAKAEIEKHIKWLKEQPSDNPALKEYVILEYGHLINFIFSEDLQNYFSKFKTITHRLDELRNESVSAVIPELSDL